MDMAVLLQHSVAKEHIYCVFDTSHGAAESLRITVSVYLCTFELTTLLLKRFHLYMLSETL